MFSPATIRDLHDRASRAARHGHKAPRPLDGPGGVREAFRTCHFLGDYVPDSWTRATLGDFAGLPPEAETALYRAAAFHPTDDDPASLFVDSSGWGSDREPALSRDETEGVGAQVLEWARARGLVVGVGIDTVGQFQCYVALYFRQRYQGDRDALRQHRRAQLTA